MEESRRTNLNEYRIMLVTIEGIDGAGKSTVVDALEREWPDAVYTREPTDSWVGDAVRRSIGDDGSPAFLDFFLFTADHADLIERVVRPAVSEDRLVFCDRYVDSRLAYQSVTLADSLDDPLEWIRCVHEPVTVWPDLTLLLDLPAEMAVRRKDGGGMKYEKTEFLKEVREQYLELAEDSRFRVVDAVREPEAVVDECVSIVRRELD